ncbi:integrative and conjugative element protein, VC0181 family [Geodermatophilus obscurus]|uniref:Integrative and conjugative element protein, VC0181 family n=1 Tax=Geodermatophilus obscurus TaxID=1861 RepID=A0A1M7V0X1_9ACTN|nr:Mov34/MPN/PAD-1 family protein [Geodermatophilus obscurus]SHN88825.1 integrative and conjugative element protein, VC0181 family [Geodermatophilus obscurus]
MTGTPVIVDVHPDATEVIAAAAAAAHPRETGGLLLGWWDAGHVVVRHAVEVPDPGATTNSWSRDEPQAQAALDAALDEHQHPWLGYVGDWHSHPAPCGASSQDVTSIRRASRQYTQPLVLLVHRADSTFDHVVAHRGCTRHATTPLPPRKEHSP